MVYFLKSGVIAGQCLDEKGKDIVSCLIYKTGDIGLSSHNIIAMNIPSPETLVALEDTVIFCMPMEYLIDIIKDNINVANFAAVKLGEALQRYRDLKVVLTQYSAKERYLWFLENYQDLITRIKHTYIASFLAMNPSTLSRVREKLEGTNTFDN